MVLHVRYNSLHISLPSSAKQQREMTSSALSEERELRQLIFKNSISNLLQCSRFSFVIASIDSDKQIKRLQSIPRLVGKMYVHFSL